MEKKKEDNWLVAIYQKYCLSKATGERMGNLDSEALVAEIIVPAKTAQEANDKGWAYIEAVELTDAVVRQVVMESPPRITFVEDWNQVS